MKRILFSVLILAGFAVAANAQSYQKAIGLRLGAPNSLSFKCFLSEKGAVEIFGSLNNSYDYGGWYNLGGLYQIHNTIPGVELEGLQWYFGGGAAVYFYHYDDGFSGSGTGAGILGCLGLDYKFEEIPLNLSLDWVPTFFLGKNSTFNAAFGQLGARYVLGGNGK